MVVREIEPEDGGDVDTVPEHQGFVPDDDGRPEEDPDGTAGVEEEVVEVEGHVEDRDLEVVSEEPDPTSSLRPRRPLLGDRPLAHSPPPDSRLPSRVLLLSQHLLRFPTPVSSVMFGVGLRLPLVPSPPSPTDPVRQAFPVSRLTLITAGHLPSRPCHSRVPLYPHLHPRPPSILLYHRPSYHVLPPTPVSCSYLL